VYEREAGHPFRWFEGFPGIWAGRERSGGGEAA
jgi:hypothetical protein